MPIKLSRYFQIDAGELRKRGVLNAHIGIDNKLFVDPHLVKKVKLPEFEGAKQDLEAYFTPIITLLSASKGKGDIAWKEAKKRLTFKEEHGTALGYANAGQFGKAIGPEMAEVLVKRCKEIIDLGITATEMFELIGLFQEGFGPDLLSDMAVSILKDRFLAYTQRITTELKLRPRQSFSIGNNQWELPIGPDGRRALIFVPAALLSKLPIALDRSEIDEVAAFNREVREYWNAIVAAASREKRVVSKEEIREMLLAKPKNLADLIRVYRKAAAKGYDFDKDPDGLLSWEFLGRAAAEANPLAIGIQRPKSIVELRTIVDMIIKQFTKNVEENKLYQVLYKENGKPHKEVFAQRLFYATADTYCEANNIDLSREPDAGNGPVDFKLSTGYTGRILVEVKKSTNSDLLHGFQTQVPAYQKSEATEESIYLIIRVAKSDSAIKSMVKFRAKEASAGRRVPDVFIVDARKKLSASKRGRKRRDR